MKPGDKATIALSEAGFIGSFFGTENPAVRAVIVLMGSDGGLAHSEYVAELFASRGIAALALAYFKYPGLSKTLSLIPLEYIENAVKWLLNETGLQSVAVYGVSKGAEYGLVASTFIPSIDCVVAGVPNYYVAEGIGKGKSRSGTSSWSHRGTPLPYAPIPGGSAGFAKTLIRERQMELFPFYQRAEEIGIPEDALILVEKSKARILLQSSALDSVWPSRRAGEKLVERLCTARYAHDFRHQCFEQSSHILNPIPDNKRWIYRLAFKAERQYPKDCDDARIEAFEDAVAWIGVS